MRFTPYAIACALLSVVISADAQQLKPENIVSPEAASLGKFGNIPVGNYTGSPEISIPLYSVKLGGVEVPIVLRYHASGIQVEQEATWVGLGWDLTVGGSVTQVVSGLADQETNLTSPLGTTYQELMRRGTANDNNPGMDNTIFATQFCVDASQPLLNDMGTVSTLKAYDWGKPDIFRISVPGISEEFMLTPVGLTPVQIGKKKTPVFITKHLFGNSGSYAPEWTVEDIAGNKYFFARTDHEYSYAEASQPLSGAVSKLTRITTAIGQVMNFSYINGKYSLSAYSASKSFDNRDLPPNPTNDVTHTTYYAKYLTGMETDHVRVVFELSSTAQERDDLQGLTIDGGYGARRLNAVHIWDKRTNRKVKSFVFTYDFFYGDINSSGRIATFPPPVHLTKRLKLLSVQEVGYTAGGAAVQNVPPYAFEYNESVTLPRKDGYARDHWGLFNAQSNSSFIPRLYCEIVTGVLKIPGVPITETDIMRNIRDAGTANKGMEPGPATAAILKKLTHPTKGFSVFHYEPHTYKNYRTYSADEVRRNVGIIATNVDDKNYNTNVITSAPLYPDADGNLKLTQFNCSFSSVGAKIDHTYFLSCYVKIWRVSASGTRTQLRQWVVTAPRDIFNQTGSQAYPPEDIILSGEPTDYYEVESHLANIPQLTPVGTSIPKAITHANWSTIDKQMVEKESIGGGLRIAAIEHYTDENKLAGKKVFKYLKEDGVTTSGKLMAPPRYFSHTLRTHVVKTVIDGSITFSAYPSHSYSVASYSYVPLSADAEGSYVGYDRVEVTDMDAAGNTNGKTVYNYKNTQSTASSNGFHTYSKSLPTVGYYSNGLVDSVTTYRNDGFLLKKQAYAYKLLERKTTRGLMLADMYCDAYINNFSCVGFDQPPNINYKWVAYFYPVNTKWYVPEVVTETEFSNVPLTITTTNTYNAYGQLVKEEKTGSKGETISKNFTYPLDVTSPGAVVTEMKSLKLYDRLLQEVLVKNGQQRLKTFDYAKNEHNHIHVTKSAESLGGQPSNDLVKNIRHDGRGNIIQFEENGVVTSFVYGYQQSLPVLKVVGADYNTVVTGLNDAVIQQPPGEAQLVAEITNVRNRFASSNTQVSGYVYSPLTGMTSEIDPSGKRIFYVYDEHGRLQHTKDKDGKILKVFQYQYQQ
ncbi:hypothetical protein [Chitinophaga lutea]|uniref:hypothetical protein n=1 Tax=Chitinophaga lutea TaxID=2488634 RepID=UPI000F4E0097|nr:hypothetical protein [Chitinophaga lutea]